MLGTQVRGGLSNAKDFLLVLSVLKSSLREDGKRLVYKTSSSLFRLRRPLRVA